LQGVADAVGPFQALAARFERDSHQSTEFPIVID
jgi:hypothetical protein